MRKEKINVIKKNLLLIGMVVCAYVGISGQMVYAEESQWQSKVDENVFEMLSEKPDEEISVCIFLEEFEDAELEECMDQKGIDMELYTDEEKFNEILEPMIADEVVQEVGFEKAYEKDMSVAVVKEAIGCNMLNRFCDWESLAAAPNLVSEAINENIKNYKKERAKSVQELCTEFNQKFVRGCNIEEDDILFNGELVRALIVKATAEEIEMYANMKEVDTISYYEEVELQPALVDATIAINADSASGTKASGYTGIGVDIGIIETGKYESDNPHLKNKSNLQYVENPRGGVEVVEKMHATYVTSIICGDAYSVDGKTYEGVVPDATVYQTSASNSGDVCYALQYFALMGIDVINCSFGVENSFGWYDSFDQLIDRLISANNLIVVVGAGNDGKTPHGNISSPGMALNAITVGNLNRVGVTYAEMYYVFDSSSYNEADYLPNKPDISAPGKVAIATGTDTVKVENGTSLSTPIVTGVIAQMLQANPSLKFNPTLVKATLLSAADDSKIATLYNPLVETGSCLSEKSGAGMVDAKASVIAAVLNGHKTITFQNQPQVISSQTFYGGQKVRIVMAMSFEDTTRIISSENGIEDADLVLLDSSGNIVAQSNSNINNVEIIEYTIPTTGTYTIRVDNYGSVLNVNARPEISVSWQVSN